jgi:4-alpha-glucanotransferase
MRHRGSGILLPVSSLPTAYGIGDLGPSAYRFADFLVQSGQSYWQVLPLNPTDNARGNSPYDSSSSFAGNPLLISPDLLCTSAYIRDEGPPAGRPDTPVDYSAVTTYKTAILDHLCEDFPGKDAYHCEYRQFCEDEAFWLDDYALFVVLEEQYRGREWSAWPGDLRRREPAALDEARYAYAKECERVKIIQFVFFSQWRALKNYCNRQGIQFIGDAPIYVGYSSADVWSHSALFSLDASGRPDYVAGAPPDAQFPDGQLWGNPVYRWDAMQAECFRWWIERMQHMMRLFDIVRIDHFRGFVAYWEVGAGERSAAAGRWTRVPANAFFRALHRYIPRLSLIAEDLGTITPDIRQTMGRLEVPGMRVLPLAFADDPGTSIHAPHMVSRDTVVYSSTHDTDTVRGWYANAAHDERKRIAAYIGHQVPEDEIAWEMIRLAMRTIADTVVIPMQDVLSLGSEGRMNTPTTTEGNWAWRMPERSLDLAAEKLLKTTTRYSGRC